MKKILLCCIPLLLFAQERGELDTNQIQNPQEIKKDLINKAGQKLDDEIHKAIEKSKDTSLENLSGFVVGLSTSLKEFNAEQIINTFEQISTKTPSLNGGLIVGYQHFFNQYAGIRVTMMANVGTRAVIKAQKLIPASQAKALPISNIMQEYLPIQAGADIKFLSTFYRNEKYAFGISAGLGYEAEWYVIKKADSDSGTQGALRNIAQHPNSIINHGLYPEFGIYYFLGGHQFELSYRFAQFAFTDNRFNNWDFDDGSKKLKTGTRFLFTSEIVLSYLYRF